MLIVAGIFALAGRWQSERETERVAVAGAQRWFIARGHAGLAFASSLGLTAVMAFASVSAIRKEWPMLVVILPLLALGALHLYSTLRLWARPGAVLQMDADGLTHARLGAVAWRDVAGMALVSGKLRRGWRTHDLVMCVHRPSRYLARMPWGFRLLHVRWRYERPAYGSIGFNLDELDCAPDTVLSAALALRRRDPAPFLDDWDPAMTPWQIDARVRQAQARREGVPAAPAADPEHADDSSGRSRHPERSTREALERTLKLRWRQGRLHRRE